MSDIVNRVPIDIIIRKDFPLKKSGPRYYRAIPHDSLVIDTKKNIFFWNSLGISGNAITWLTQIKGYSVAGSLKYLESMTGFPFTKPLDMINMPTPIYPGLISAFYELGKSHRSYWYNRGFSNDTIEVFKLGYTGKCWAIPVVVNNILENFQCRLTKKDTGKRVWNWRKNKGTLPFNVDAIPIFKDEFKYLIITEGPTDTIALHEMGLPGISYIGEWQSSWSRYIIHFDKVFILYDNDNAGNFKAKRVVKRLLNRGCVVSWPSDCPWKYDVNNCLKDLGKTKAREYILNMLDNHSCMEANDVFYTR